MEKRFCFLCGGELSHPFRPEVSICDGGEDYDGCGLVYYGENPGVANGENYLLSMIEEIAEATGVKIDTGRPEGWLKGGVMAGEKTDWVDFKAIKAAVTLRMVLDDHYGLTNWKAGKGDELRGPCPLPGCNGKRSFSWNPVKNAFQCFDCKARGNVLDFVAKKENCSVRDAALKVAEWFKLVESAGAALLDVPPATIEMLRQLSEELDTHAAQVAYHASLVEAKTAAIKKIVAAFDKGG